MLQVLYKVFKLHRSSDVAQAALNRVTVLFFSLKCSQNTYPHNKTELQYIHNSEITIHTELVHNKYLIFSK